MRFDFLKPPSPSLNTSKRIKETIKELGPSKKILDLGSGNRRLAPWVKTLDIASGANVDIVASADNIPIQDNYFDAVICQAVLEHVKKPQKVVQEIKRVLKQGGLVYAEIPFLQGYHADPNDYQRYTLQGIEELFSGFKKIETGVCVGPTSALLWILRKYPGTLFNNEFVSKLLDFIFGWLLFPIKYLDYFLTKKKKAHKLAAGLFFLGRKI